ncbi:LuxR family transcriptional regulator [Ensifer sp. MPMI2T]|nr:LuxR family transcriptional regulator [Ensifer sp. MPMI2T]
MLRQIDHAILRSVAIGDDEMDDGEADPAGILAVIRAETDAWLQRDYEGWASHWVQSPQTRRMESWASLGVRVDEGWDAIAARIKKIMARFPEKHAFVGRVRWEKVNVVVDGHVAWVSFDQIGSDTAEDRKRQLRILHRIDGVWKIGCAVVMECTVGQTSCPLIEVDAEARILWTNRLARERMRDYPGLIAATGRVRARRRDRDVGLREAVRLAFCELQSQRPLNVVPKQSWSVALGEDAAGVPLHCWVLLEDGKVLIAFDDAETVERRIASAREVFGLSPAQTRLARLIVDGLELAAASDVLQVSVNTLRTQLQRIFDKTGVRSQAALVRTLLSTEVPTK